MTDTFTKEQLDKRKQGIGASEAAAICGLSPWQGPLDVYLVKTGQMTIEDNENMRRGRVLEPALREWWAQLHPEVEVKRASTAKHPGHDFIYATPDGIVSVGGWPTAVLELKSPARTTNHWGTPGTDQIPSYYIPQVMQQMACTGLQLAEVGGFIWGELKLYQVEFDAELWESIAELEYDFWHNHVLKRIPPDYEGSQLAIEWLQKRHPEAVSKEILVASSAADEAAAKLCQVQADIKHLKAEETAIKAQLIEEIGDAYGVETSVGKVLHYNVAGRKKLDIDRLVHDLGGTQADIDKHTTRGAPSRVLRGYWNE